MVIDVWNTLSPQDISTHLGFHQKKKKIILCFHAEQIIWILSDRFNLKSLNRKTNKKPPSLLPLTIFSLCLGYCDNGFVPVGPTGGWETLGLCICQRCSTEWWESQRKWGALKFFLTISVALIEDIISVCESCHTLGLKSDVFTALYFKKVEE